MTARERQKRRVPLSYLQNELTTMLKKPNGLVFVLLSLGCATSPGTQANVPQERVTVVTAGLGAMNVHSTADAAGTYWADAPIDQVWTVLPQIYEELGVQLAVHDSVGKRIGNASFRVRRIGGTRLSQYLRCGGSGATATPNADRYQVTMSLTTRLSEAPEGGTGIVTLLGASARPRDVGGTVVNCASTGRLEERISEMVSEALRR